VDLQPTWLLSTLTAKELGDEAIKPGDEVIMLPPLFQQLVNPILNIRRSSGFLDVTIPYYEIDTTHLEAAF